ncbi:MAG: Ribosomal adenine methylase transferase [Alphaproteobacteria bacterium]|nr:Ribosomal adenine methylase transferase [Alphaproteobacteria bacterium]MDB5741284.1 Ribosomal adenine methylase transferase [Alphaproteobacteria bacterium]
MSSAAAYGDFLRGLISNPRAVSAPTPSSPTLARAIAAQVDLGRDGLVIELGPGTGVVTQALLEHGVPADRLVAIELEGSFARLMRKRFPKVTVHHGDAVTFESQIAFGARVAAIVSGLPLLQLPLETRRSLLRRALACQDAGGAFVQLSYSWRPPVPPEPGMTLTRKTVWRNFPPAHVWTYRAG